jgi:acyl-CoA thioesterase
VTDDTRESDDGGAEVDAEGDADVLGGEVVADVFARELHRRDPSAATFGIELLDASPSGATVRMPVRREHCNGFDILHGGMTFLLADSAMAFASNARGETALASSAEIDWLAPVGIGTVLTATATQRWHGGRSALWDVTVTDDAGATVAVMRGRTRTVGR